MSLIQEITRTARALLVEKATEEPVDAVTAVIDDMVVSGVFPDNEPNLQLQALADLTGFGALQPFLEDSKIEEIWSNKPNQIFIATDSGTKCLPVSFDSAQIQTTILRMLQGSGRRIDTSMPFADAALPDGSRLHVVIPEVTSQHWAFNIRKFPAELFSLDDLVQLGSISESQRHYLSEAVTTGKNILVSGATHAGKTTVLCALLNELPQDCRLITCEETFEIRSNLPDRVSMQTRQANLEGRGEIGLRRLVKEALRMRPTRLVIGEVREAEALDMLIGMNSGIPGACTIHANSAQAALVKLCTLPLLAGPNISSAFVLQTAAQSIDLLVHCSNDGSGRRWISEVCRVVVDASGSLIAEPVQC